MNPVKFVVHKRTVSLLSIALFVACSGFGCSRDIPTDSNISNDSKKLDPNFDSGRDDKSKPKEDPAELKHSPLEGTWGSLSASKDGHQLMVGRAQIQFIVSGTKVLRGFTGGMEDGEIKVVNTNQFDAFIGGQAIKGIFRTNGNRLDICFAPNPRPRPVDFRTTEGDGRRFYGFQRIHPEKVGTKVSEEEFNGLVRDIKSSAENGDSAAINLMIDFDGILENATLGYGITENMRLSFIYGVKRKSIVFNPNVGVGGQITDAVQSGGEISLLRKKRTANRIQALFRLVTGDGSVNYFNLSVGRNCFGDVCVSDFYIFGSGEWVSNLVNRVLFPSLASISPRIKNSPSAKQKAMIDSFDAIREMTLAKQRGEIDKTIEIYFRLPLSVQKEKSFFLIALSGAISGDHTKFGRLVQHGKNLFPNDPALELLYVDYYIENGLYEKAHEAVGVLNKKLGGDAYLNTVRASIFLKEKKYKDARKAAQIAVDAFPKLSYPYLILLVISLETKDDTETARLCRILETRFKWSLDDFESFDGFESFKKSDSFRDWNQSGDNK